MSVSEAAARRRRRQAAARQHVFRNLAGYVLEMRPGTGVHVNGNFDVSGFMPCLLRDFDDGRDPNVPFLAIGQCLST